MQIQVVRSALSRVPQGLMGIEGMQVVPVGLTDAGVNVPHVTLTALTDVEWATAGWVNWYNNRRLQQLGLLSPREFEQAHYAAINREPQPA